MARNPVNDITWISDSFDLTSAALTGTLSGYSLEATRWDIEPSLNGSLVLGRVFNGSFRLYPSLDADFYLQRGKFNWAVWSKIGEFDFTIDQSNIAGEMPVEGAGSILASGKLNNSVIMYGTNGVAILTPHGHAFGKGKILPIGIKSRGSLIVTLAYHLFIDTAGQLWKLSDKLDLLGYDEFLSQLSDPIMSFDEINNLAYICDGTRGYVYSIVDGSLGTCSPNITGIVYYEGSSYVMASGQLSQITPYIVTGPVDFGNRNFKTISEIELGGEFNNSVELGIGFKNASNTAFSSPVWFNVTPEGRTFPVMFAKEFKFYIRTSDSTLRIDYLRLKGIFADYNPID